MPKTVLGPVYVATSSVRAAPPINTDHQSIGVVKPAPIPDVSAASGDNLPESSNLHEEGVRAHVYIYIFLHHLFVYAIRLCIATMYKLLNQFNNT